jgi:hypothetical protein
MQIIQHSVGIYKSKLIRNHGVVKVATSYFVSLGNRHRTTRMTPRADFANTVD